MARIEDRIAFPRTRKLLDLVLGDLVADTLVLRLPELWRVRGGHFSDSLSGEEKRQLFRRSVRFVEIEIHSYCNRTCWFCPNADIDRRSVRHYLSEATYLRIIGDLQSIGYSRELSFSRFNEPFGDEVVFDRIAQARSALPRCQLLAFSNGDFVTASALVRMRKAGLSHLFLACYPPNDQPWSREYAETQIASKASKLGLRLCKRRETPGSRIGYESSWGHMPVTIYCPNFRVGGLNRGGMVEGVPANPCARTSPCLLPFYRVAIDHTGCVMPCCNLRSDIDAHRPTRFGVLDDTSGTLFDAYASASAASWRTSVVSYGDKPSACQGCLYHDWAGGPVIRAFHKVALALSASRC